MASLDPLLCAKMMKRKPRSRLDNSTRCNGMSRMKPNSRRCNTPNCRKTAKRGGRCIAHGGGNKCAIDGCTTSVVSRGLCVAHGGGKRCQAPICAKSAQSGGFCWVHGGGKKCGYHGCPKRAQSGGACIAHGGGKRCRIGGCTKVVQYDGLCVGHGGYRRCVYTNCDQRAMANDHCQAHGGSSVCLLDCCCKRAVRGGMCSEHKAEASHQAVTAGGLSPPSQTSDDDQNRQVDRFTNQLPPTIEWQGRMHSIHLTSNEYSKLRGGASDLALVPDKGSPCAELTHENADRDDSPLAPGFSALLNADDNVALLSRMHSTHQEPKVYPLLPSIRSLQTYRTDATPLYSPTTSNVGIVFNQDQALVKWVSTTGPEHHERAHSKVFVHSYYNRPNDDTQLRHSLW